MGNQSSIGTIGEGHLSPGTLKRQLSEYALHSENQVSVVKSSRLYDNEYSYEEDPEPGLDDEQSPHAISWATTPPSLSIHDDAEAYRILSGREDSITVSERSISRPSSPGPELQISLSPQSDVGDGFFPPTPRGASPESRAETVCTPTSVRRYSLTQTANLDSSDTPKGTRLSRRGGVCAFHDSQIPDSIRSLRSQHFENIGGGPCPEEGRTRQRTKSLHDWTTIRIESTSSLVESTSSETLASPHPRRSLRRARTEYDSISSWRIRSFVNEGSTAPNLIGGSRIP